MSDGYESAYFLIRRLSIVHRADKSLKTLNTILKKERTTMTYGSVYNSTEDIFWRVYFKLLPDYLPLIIFLTVAAITGIIGNIMVVKFYRQRSQSQTSFRVLVKALACTDCSVSILLLAASAEITLNIAFNYRYLCKVLYFIFEWAIYSSVLILVVITIDRYRKICHAFKAQLSVKMAKYSIPCIAVLTLVLSARNVVIYDIASVNITVEEGNGTSIVTCHYCTGSQDPALQTYVTAFHISDIVVSCCNFLVFTLSYGLIIHKLILHRNTLKGFHKSDVYHHKSHGNENIENDDDPNTADTSVENSDGGKVDVHTVKPISTAVTRKPGQKIRRSEYKITIMMLLVSAVFLLSLSPFFIASFLYHDIGNSGLAISPFRHFMVKCVFLNSVSNPIIYYIYNNEFRASAHKMLTCRYKDA